MYRFLDQTWSVLITDRYGVHYIVPRLIYQHPSNSKAHKIYNENNSKLKTQTKQQENVIIKWKFSFGKQNLIVFLRSVKFTIMRCSNCLLLLTFVHFYSDITTTILSYRRCSLRFPAILYSYPYDYENQTSQSVNHLCVYST